MNLKWNLTFAALLTLMGTAQIVGTYAVLNQTYDEPYHIAAGMEWLQRQKYKVETLHPPLARIAVALVPFLTGNRLASTEELSWRTFLSQGNDLLHSGDSYSQNLSYSRLGVLPFFLIATAIVWTWSWKLFGATAALLGTALFTTLPTVLAHSGLATTDMPAAATLSAALFAFSLWLINLGTAIDRCEGM